MFLKMETRIEELEKENGQLKEKAAKQEREHKDLRAQLRRLEEDKGILSQKVSEGEAAQGPEGSAQEAGGGQT